MKRFFLAFPVSVAILAILVWNVSTQEQPEPEPDISCMAEYDQDVGDPGTGNYGDLICDLGTVQPVEKTPVLLYAATHINSQNVSMISTHGLLLNGYHITKVNYLNFGRQRGFVDAINITNDYVGFDSYMEVQYITKQNTFVRLRLEVYGNSLPGRENASKVVSKTSSPYTG